MSDRYRYRPVPRHARYVLGARHAAAEIRGVSMTRRAYAILAAVLLAVDFVAEVVIEYRRARRFLRGIGGEE